MRPRDWSAEKVRFWNASRFLKISSLSHGLSRWSTLRPGQSRVQSSTHALLSPDERLTSRRWQTRSRLCARVTTCTHVRPVGDFCERSKRARFASISSDLPIDRRARAEPSHTLSMLFRLADFGDYRSFDSHLPVELGWVLRREPSFL